MNIPWAILEAVPCGSQLLECNIREYVVSVNIMIIRRYAFTLVFSPFIREFLNEKLYYSILIHSILIKLPLPRSF